MRSRLVVCLLDIPIRREEIYCFLILKEITNNNNSKYYKDWKQGIYGKYSTRKHRYYKVIHGTVTSSKCSWNKMFSKLELQVKNEHLNELERLKSIYFCIRKRNKSCRKQASLSRIVENYSGKNESLFQFCVKQYEVFWF